MKQREKRGGRETDTGEQEAVEESRTDGVVDREDSGFVVFVEEFGDEKKAS